MVTAETLPRHELAGLYVRVVEARHEGYVGIAGSVVDETRNTLLIGASRRRVPKAECAFEFELPSGDHVVVEGARLVADPARRTELTGDSKWR
jgi:ribonuclease P protein subunit POP4